MVPEFDLIPIVDPEVEFKASNPTWLAEEARKAETKAKNRGGLNNHQNDEDDEDFIIDTVGDARLRDVPMEKDDYVGFEETDSDDNVQLHLGPDRGLIQNLNHQSFRL